MSLHKEGLARGYTITLASDVEIRGSKLVVVAGNCPHHAQNYALFHLSMADSFMEKHGVEIQILLVFSQFLYKESQGKCCPN